jgi:hypothetical protein
VREVRLGGSYLPSVLMGLCLDFFEEATYNFPVKSKRDFNKEVLLSEST